MSTRFWTVIPLFTVMASGVPFIVKLIVPFERVSELERKPLIVAWAWVLPSVSASELVPTVMGVVLLVLAVKDKQVEVTAALIPSVALLVMASARFYSVVPPLPDAPMVKVWVVAPVRTMLPVRTFPAAAVVAPPCRLMLAVEACPGFPCYP